MLQALDNSLIGDKDSTVELWDEESEKLWTCLKYLSSFHFIAENVIKVTNHWRKKLLYQLITQSWFELRQKVIAFYELLVVMRQRFFDIVFDFVVKDLWKWLTHTGVVQFDEPNVYFVAFGLDNVDVALCWQEAIYSTHDDGEDQDSNKLDHHREDVFCLGCSIDITIADSGQRGHNPVDWRNVDSLGIVLFLRDVKIRIS